MQFYNTCASKHSFKVLKSLWNFKETIKNCLGSLRKMTWRWIFPLRHLNGIKSSRDVGGVYLWVWSGPAACRRPVPWSPWCRWWRLRWWRGSRCTASPRRRRPPTPRTARTRPDIRETLTHEKTGQNITGSQESGLTEQRETGATHHILKPNDQSCRKNRSWLFFV